MRVVIFGATGFVGWAVLHEALASAGVSAVVLVGRRPVGIEHAKLGEILVDDVGHLDGVAGELAGLDARFWCLGVSSQGMDEEAYTEVTYTYTYTYTYTMRAARMLGDLNPELEFMFVSGEGADGNAMWARVKKRTEDALLDLPEILTNVFRPAFIRSSHGARLRGRLYRIAYCAVFLAYPVFRVFGVATSSAEIGRAMIVASHEPLRNPVLNSREINRLASRVAAPDAEHRTGQRAG